MSRTRHSKLSVDHIKRALNDLYYASTSSATYLKFARLQLVEKRMQSLPKISIADSALLQYTVQELLSELIEINLNKQRCQLHLKYGLFSKLETYKQAIEDIKQDASTRSPNLIGWSLLYHVQLRPDLNISHREFAELVHIHVRTARRYKDMVLNLLLQDIIHLEVMLSPEYIGQLHQNEIICNEEKKS